MIIAFLISLIALIILRPLALKIKLVDYPNERKNHIGNIPLIGGISVFLGLLISYFFFIEFDKFVTVLIITSALMLIVGVLDDFVSLKVSTKIIFQVFASAIMIYYTDVKVENFGYLFGASYPLELGILSIPITIIAVIGLTNAINMIDGLDGLAGCIALIAIIGMVFFNLTLEFSPFTYIFLSVAFALLPLITFNIVPYPKLKVFLGDGGSLFLGHIISWGLIYSTEKVSVFTPSFVLWCVAVPLFDFVVVIILRIINKHSLINARKDHIHHFLQNLALGKYLILLLITSSGLVLLLIGILIEKNFPALSFPLFLTLFLFYLIIRIKKNRKKVKIH